MKVAFIALCCFSWLSGVSQKYDQLEIGNFKLYPGDTLHFLQGSRSGQFEHVFTLWHSKPPVKSLFNGANSWLVIDHFKRKKKEGIRIIYAVCYLPNINNVRVYVDVANALKSKELLINDK